MSLKQLKIAFIGCGHMAHSLVVGLLKESYSQENILVTGRNEKRLQHFKQSFGVKILTDNIEAAKKADIVVLCVKPVDLHGVCQQISNLCQERKPLIISVAAGVPLKLLSTWLGEAVPVVRSMPNMASAIGMGTTGLVANATVTKHQAEYAETLMLAVGKVFWVENDKQMDTVTALAGSGPGYVFLFMEALYSAALKAGLTEQIAKEMTQQMVAGAAMLAKDYNGDFSELRTQISVKGGTTEAALLTFEAEGFSELVEQALNAAINRASEISDEVGE